MFDLESIENPQFIKKLKIKELKALAQEIREFLINNVSETGGHLSSNLGVVEITLAMYYVFDPEKDKFLFDVGHQSYVHKILTGRAKDFKTLRQFGGLSGYINKTESKYDVWESGHSSTTISAMAGILPCLDKDSFCISLIGDSSISNGVAFEGLNYIGNSKENRAIIILNDNKMGISKSVGAISKMFAKMRGTKLTRGFKSFFVKITPSPIARIYHRIKRSIKALFQNDNVFEDMGYDYYGPYNGNNIKQIISLFKRVKKHPNRPILLHLHTIKGLGYEFAEHDGEGNFHGVPPFDIKTGKPKVVCENKISYSQLVSDYLVKKRENTEFKVITPAMKSGAKLSQFEQKYKSDFIDVGIAEEHATVMGAGSVLMGKKVVLLMYSTFSQRAFDFFLNDVSRQNLGLIIGLDRAGIVGEDGSTHQGLYDVSMFMMMPNVIVTSPRNMQETIGLFNYAFKQNQPIVIRYPRKCENKIEFDYNFETNLDWEIIKEGSKLNILGYGTDIELIKNICDDNNLDINVIDCKCIKPLDNNMLDKIFDNKKDILVVEQVVSSGTLYDKILEYKEEHNYNSKIHKHSFDSETIVEHGSLKDVYEKYGFSESKLLDKIKEVLK